MPHIQLSDELYQIAKQSAADSGFATVDEYIEFLLQENLLEDSRECSTLEHFFTPERMAEINEAAAEADSGQLMSMEQLDDYLAKQRQAWLAQKSA